VPSRTELKVRAATFAVAAVVAVGLQAASPQIESTATRSARPDQSEIARAMDRVKADPNLATERKIHLLRWTSSGQSKPSSSPRWLAWIAGFFRWFGQSARLLVWASAGLLAGLLLVYLVRTVRPRLEPRTTLRNLAPTHVQSLDIRPESLPADIGHAARVLWERGEHRAALALLYRGLLSRLAHVHHVPIRDSSTEGDCLTLAASHLTEDRHAYAAQLVRVWQLAVYGAQGTETATVYLLCDRFASALDPAADVASSGNSHGAGRPA
jgi:hypothetical protein